MIQFMKANTENVISIVMLRKLIKQYYLTHAIALGWAYFS